MHTASATLKTIATAQFDFRECDRDGNDVKDFWRPDIAGLHFLSREGNLIRLVDPETALADDRAVTEVPAGWGPPGPKAGFHFRALRLRDETSPDPNRFAACAVPAPYERGRHGTYIIASHDLTVYKKDLGPSGTIDCYPVDPIKDGWEPLD